ncbi:MAG: hypothetical protein ACFUZC_06780 [Chthoniobacteraceae bacterium]
MPPFRKTAPRWGTLALRFGIGLVILVVAAYLAASYALNHYLHGEAFRALLSQKTSALLAADGHYEPIQINGFAFYSDGYTARGLPGSPIQALKADQIRAEFEPAALYEGAWKIGSVQIQRVKVDLGEPLSAATAATEPPQTAPLPSPAAAPSPVKIPSWIPSRFELKAAKIEEASLTWSHPGREGALNRTHLRLEPNGHELNASGYGGTLTQAGLPTLNVDHFKIRYHHPQLYVTDSLLQLGEGEALDVSGQADLGPARSFDFLVKYSGVAISPYLPEDWRAGVSGKANGEARVTGSERTLQATGNVVLAGAHMEALPFLEKIAAFTRTRQFRQFALQKAEAEYVWTPGKLVLSNINAESEGLIRISGTLSVENGQAQGDFQVGVTPASLKWLPGSRNRVFTQEHDGYAWAPLKISGPVNHMNEDLSARLTAAAGEELIEGVKGSLENGAKSLFDLIKSQVR